MKRLVLAGGGHAHLSVLQSLSARQEKNLQTVLVTPDRYQYYSGMLPGFMAGHYTVGQCRVDLAPLAQQAGAKLLLASVTSLNAAQHRLALSDGTALEYDLLSLDVGSSVHAQGLQALGDAYAPAKPLGPFFERWPQCVAAARHSAGYSVVVVGAGAAGLELALAAAHALRDAQARVHLVGPSDSFLAGHSAAVRRRSMACLQDAGVQWHAQRAQGVAQGLPSRPTAESAAAGAGAKASTATGTVILTDGTALPCDTLIATTGAQALGWLGASGLAVNAQGFVAVNAHHQSTSHTNVFAVGDCCARADTAMQRSGVHAVRAGPVLAHNLHAVLTGGNLQAYSPRKRSLYLLACGPRHAVASWGPLSAEGAWVWLWKDRIDRGFVQRFSAPVAEA